MLFQCSSLDISILDELQLNVRVPSSFRRLRGLPQHLFRVCNPYRHKVAIGKFLSRQCPRRFIDDDFRVLIYQKAIQNPSGL